MKRYALVVTAMLLLLASGCTSDGDGAQNVPIVTECFGSPLPGRAIGTAEPPAPPDELPGYWPTEAWRSADPTLLGFDPAQLDAAISFETDHSRTQALVVVRHGYIAAERFVGGFTATTRHESYSMAKSVASALIGIAIEQGLLADTNKRLCEVYDEWDCADDTDARSRITLDHVMNISSGLEWHEDWRSNSTGNDIFRAFPNVVDFTLSRPAVSEPGEIMRYSTGDPSLLTSVIQDATGHTAAAFAQQEIFAPLGLPPLPWGSDGAGRTTTYAGLQATALEYAKLGLLYLRQGEWDGEQIVPEEWVTHTTQPVDRCNDVYRYLWHVNAPIRLGVADPACAEIIGCPPLMFANLPADAYFAEGVLGQFIFVIPSQDLVVVRLAQDDAGSEHWDEWAREFLTRLLDAVGA